MLPKAFSYTLVAFALAAASSSAATIYDPTTNRSYGYDSTVQTWESARQAAINAGGSLITISNQRENDIANALGGDSWIGFTDSEAYGGTEFGDTSGQQNFPLGNRGAGWVWVDATVPGFQNWGGGEPNDAGGEDFANIRGDGLWNDLPAFSTLASIFEFAGNRAGVTFKGHTYYLIAPGDWDTAESQAIAMGGHLASISDAEENAFVDSLIPDDIGSVWIGLHDRAIEGQFAWVDGTPLTYTNWNAGEPNNFGPGEDLGEFQNGGSWNDNENYNGNRYAIVEVVPEPGSALLLAAALPILLRRRTRRPA